jgi:hypothetical protein
VGDIVIGGELVTGGPDTPINQVIQPIRGKAVRRLPVV